MKYFCLFIGYPRSGHSIVGALLDAHPNIVISNELDVMQFIYHNKDRESIYKTIIHNSKKFAQKGSKSRDKIYFYPVDGQGKSENIEVIGDKKGGGTSEWIFRYPNLIDKAHNILGLPIKFIHVVRNPFDNISAMVIRHKGDISRMINVYFNNHNSGVSLCMSKVNPKNWLTIHQEDFVKNTKLVLSKICAFLDQDATEEYLEKCQKIVNPIPHKTRYEISWTKKQKDRVLELNQKFSYLKNYSF